MALIFSHPSIVNTQSNPAEDFAASGGTSFDLGFTEPRYNGTVALQRRGMFGSPPITVTTHDVNVTGPASNVFTATVDKVYNHYFTWKIELPRRPTDQYIVNYVLRSGWKSAPKPILNIVNLCSQFKQKRPMSFPRDVPSANGYRNGVIYFLPAPSPREFLDHIVSHEFQHVADHRWLAEQIFGPIDRWAQTAMSKKIKFEGPNKYGLLNAVQFPGSYAISAQRIYNYWAEAIRTSGDLFHQTQEGSFPKLTLLDYRPSNNDSNVLVVVFEIEAVRHMGSSTGLYSQPHSTFKLVAADDSLDGNEPRISSGPAVNRTIQTPDVENARSNAVIQLGGSQSNVVEMGDWFFEQ